MPDTLTQKSFFSKKVSKYHSRAKIYGYHINNQYFSRMRLLLKMEGEVSSKYHKMGRSIIKIGLCARKICQNVFKICMKKDKKPMLMGKKIKYSCS